jgi:glycine/D-amino acid oxidase-like deaminating enzyme
MPQNARHQMTRTRYGVSPWLGAAAKKTTYPALAERLEIPIVIIGGGLTGAATAYACAAAGLRVALLEADRLGHGRSGMGSGIIQQAPPVGIVQMEAQHGRRLAKIVSTAWRRAALELAATMRRLNIHAGFTPADGLAWAHTPDAARSLERELAARRVAGLDGTWLTARALAGIGLAGAGGIRTRGDATVDPLRLCGGFARAAAARGAMLFERTRAVAVSQARGRIEIQSARGRIACETVIVATGEPAGLFDPLVRHAAACSAYAVQTPAAKAAVRAAVRDRSLILQDSQQPPHRLAWTAGDRILWTGADTPRVADRVLPQTVVQRTGQLMYELSLVLPDISGVQPEHGWHVPYSVGRDGLPIVGPHRGYPHHLFAFGLGTNPGAAFLASRLLLRHLSGTSDKADAAFGFNRAAR